MGNMLSCPQKGAIPVKKQKTVLVAAVLFIMAAALNLLSMYLNYLDGLPRAAVILNGAAALCFAVGGIAQLVQYFQLKKK